jgi:hypothetical protein
MTYTFKLSRRLARLKTAGTALIAATFVVTACTGDQTTGPESTPAGDPNTVSVAPGSVYISPHQAMQFQASLDNLSSSSLSSTSKGNGRARGRRTVVDLALVPDTLTVAEGSAASFVANATFSDGSVSQATVSWSATGGTIDANGKFTAGPIPGGYVVSATASNGIADTAAVIVTQSPPAVTGVTLSPTSASLPVGGSKRFVAMGKSIDGLTVAVSPKYAATGGTVSADGVYQAGQTPGNFRVVATDTLTQLADTAAVIIEPPPATLQAVVLSPSTASLAAGGTQRFTATGKMSDGSSSSVVVSWSVTGGQITSDGLYTAGTTAGTFRVIATQQGGTLADTSTVSITAPATAPSAPQAGSLPTPLRTVNVATTAALKAAIESALPGDRIVMASGTYTVGWYSGITRPGTATNPIVLTGPSTAVLSASTLVVNAGYWIFNGFRITGGEKGIFHIGGSYNIYEYLQIDHVNTEGMEIRTAYTSIAGTPVVGTVIRYNEIHHTGQGAGMATFGEGIYVADPSGVQLVTGSSIHHNNIHDITSEGIELKGGANNNTIEFNTISVGGPAGITIRGNNNVVNDNTVSNSNFANFTIGTNVAGVLASNNLFHRNTGSNYGSYGKMFFVDATASGTQIFCDNKGLTGAVVAGSCIP